MKKFKKDIPANDKKWLYNEYVLKKKSIREISNICKVSPDSIKTRLNRFDISVRGRGEANKLSGHKKPNKYKKTDAMIRKHESQKTGIFIKCKNCGCSFYINPSQKSSRKFCSVKCYWEWGSLNRVVQENWRDEPEYNIWRKSVYKRDSWKCFICGSKKNINAHHIYHGSTNPEKRFVLENGITLCELHHINLHKKPRSFVKELTKKISNIGEHPEMDNPEASISEMLYAVTTTKRQPERLMG